MAEPAVPLSRVVASLQQLPGGGAVAAPRDDALAGDGSPNDPLLSGVTHDSRAVRPGWMFCAVVGAERDGHDFASEAVAAGAVALLVERPLGLGVPEVVVTDVRVAMATAAAQVWGRPGDGLRLVGVTGTNGKTTVVHFLSQVLGALGARPGVVGTLTGARTTPESTDLQAALASMRDAGDDHVCMEVSSHALALHRVDALTFDVAVFTNLGRDHLDFHGTQEAYFAAKARLFEPDMCRTAVLNVDDVHGRLLSEVARVPVVRVSLADLPELRLGPDGSEFTWRGERVHLGVPGRHNVTNALLAAEAAAALGLEPARVAASLSAVAGAPGRFETVDLGQRFAAVVDYAHTPDALEVALEAARLMAQGPGGRVLLVVGCGGDRDRAKRPEMGRVATTMADVVVLTDDNPRSEDPEGIIEEILAGCQHEPVVRRDRRQAVREALDRARPGDVVLVAGKGHEVGQQYAGRTEPFDDRVVVAEELRSLGLAGGGDAP